MKRYILIGATAVLGFSMFSGTAFAGEKPSALNPTSDLYSTTRVMENVSFTLTDNVADKAILQEEFSNKRLIEIELSLKNGDTQAAEKLINDYNVSLTAANELIKEANKHKGTRALLKSTSIITSDLLKKDAKLLTDIMKNNSLPLVAIQGIQRAISNQKVVFKPIFTAISKAEKEKAMQKDNQNGATASNTTTVTSSNDTTSPSDATTNGSSWSSSSGSTMTTWGSDNSSASSSQSSSDSGQSSSGAKSTSSSVTKTSSSSDTKSTSSSNKEKTSSSSSDNSNPGNNDSSSTKGNTQGKSGDNTPSSKDSSSGKTNTGSDSSSHTGNNSQGDSNNQGVPNIQGNQNNQGDPNQGSGGLNYWCNGVISSTPICSSSSQ